MVDWNSFDESILEHIYIKFYIPVEVLNAHIGHFRSFLQSIACFGFLRIFRFCRYLLHPSLSVYFSYVSDLTLDLPWNISSVDFHLVILLRQFGTIVCLLI